MQEEVVRIMIYCIGHKITYKLRLAKHNISVGRLYDCISCYAGEQFLGSRNV